MSIEPHTHPDGSAGLIAEVADHRLDVAIAAVPADALSAVKIIELVHEDMFAVSLVIPDDRPGSTAPRAFVALVAEQAVSRTRG